MIVLKGDEEREAQAWFKQAANYARMYATCERAKAGAVIVRNNQVIGMGANSPPGNIESQRRCGFEKSSYDPKVTDRTCCVHAEQRAMDAALFNSQSGLSGSKLYFIRLDAMNEMVAAGDPYCTVCSKRALDLGVEKFLLWGPDAIREYETEEYNDLSFAYRKP